MHHQSRFSQLEISPEFQQFNTTLVMKGPAKNSFVTLLLYFCCIALVLLYVNTFELYRLLAEQVTTSLILLAPLVIAAFIVLILALCPLGKRERNIPFLITGVLLCVAGLLIPDPQIPVKRIHVAEYLLLSLLVRYTMARGVNGLPLLLFSGTVTMLLGIHDEFLQGLHPYRTYGLRDMTVNGISGWGGACIGHALSLFSARPDTEESTRQNFSRLQWLQLCWLIFAVPALAGPTVLFLGEHQPFWPSAPLAGYLILLLVPQDRSRAGYKNEMFVISFFSVSLLLYPFLANWQNHPFY